MINQQEISASHYPKCYHEEVLHGPLVLLSLVLITAPCSKKICFDEYPPSLVTSVSPLEKPLLPSYLQ
jgi:hypothetical protein